MEKANPRDLILSTLAEKASLKQDVFHNTIQVFKQFKESAREIAEGLHHEMSKKDSRIIIEFIDKGEFEAELRVAGDVLIFHMHTNIFDFDKSHSIWKTSYVKENALRSYCGTIFIYNFLTDSLKFNRINDIGYLIARVFVNMDFHYFVEGKRQLGFLYNDFVNGVLDKEHINAIIESAILYCLDFDLLTPPYEAVKQTTVYEMQEWRNSLQTKTGKRLGFKFQADVDDLI